MPHFSKLSYLFALNLLVSSHTFAQERESQHAISVASKESQGGQVLAVVSKTGTPAPAVNAAKSDKASMSASDKTTVSATTLVKHQQKQAAAPLQKPFERQQSNSNPDFWIYDAFVTFQIDNDYDGYYSTFSVEFDADTYFSQAQVYARLYLSRGDVFEEYHTTSLFYINGDSSSDSFVVESDLLTGFPSGDYELLIELYDSYDDSLVASFDGYNDADLTLLTLESKSYEQTETVVVVSSEHGGSFGYLMLLLIPILIQRTIKRD